MRQEMDLRAESRHGSVELTGTKIRIESQNWTGEAIFEAGELKAIEFREATKMLSGEIRLEDQSNGQVKLPFAMPENADFRVIAQRIDSLRRGQGSQLMPITTGHEIPGREIEEVIDVITSEAAMGINLFRDIANVWRDAVGGRSKSLQGVLREARELCFSELRTEARRRFADAVIGVDLDYTEFSSTLVQGGMIMVVASGTAVRLKPLTDLTDLSKQ